MNSDEIILDSQLEFKLCEEATDYVNDLLGFSPHKFERETVVLYREFRPFVFTNILRINIILLAYFMPLLIIIYIIRAPWLQNKYSIPFFKSSWSYCFCCFLLSSIGLPINYYVALTIFSLLLINYSLSFLTSKNSINTTLNNPQITLLQRLYQKKPDFQISPEHAKYFRWVSIFVRFYYCTFIKEKYFAALTEISAVLSLSNEPRLALECLSRFPQDPTKPSTSKRITRYKLDVQKASIFLAMKKLSEAEEILAQLPAEPPKPKKNKNWILYCTLVKARVAAGKHKYERAFELYESMHIELLKQLSPTKKLVLSSEKNIFIFLFQVIEEDLACLRYYCKQFSEAFDGLNEALEKAQKYYSKETFLPLKIFALHLKSQVDQTIVENEVTVLFDDVNEDYIAYNRFHSKRHANEKIIPIRSQDDFLSDNAPSEKVKLIEAQLKNALSTKSPIAQPIVENFIKLAIVSANCGYFEVSTDCLEKALFLQKQQTKGAVLLFIELCFITIFIKEQNLDKAKYMLVDLVERNEYDENILFNVYSNILFGIISILSTNGLNRTGNGYFLNAKDHLEEAELRILTLSLKESEQIVCNKPKEVESVYDESISYMQLFCPLGFIINFFIGLWHQHTRANLAASKDFKEGLIWLEKKRISLESFMDIQLFKKDFSWAYNLAIESYFDAGSYKESLQMVEKTKCLHLQALSIYSELDITEVEDTHLLKHYDRLKSDLKKYQEKFHELSFHTSEKPIFIHAFEAVFGGNTILETDLEEIGVQIEITLKELDKALIQIRRKHPKYETVRRSMVLEEDFFEKVNPNNTIIDYFICNNHLYIFVIENTKVHAVKNKFSDILIFNSQAFYMRIEELINTFNEFIRSTSYDFQNLKNYSDILYTLCLDPILHYIWDKNRLCIIPDGPLFNLPFQVLYDSRTKNYLLNAYQIQYLPSLSFLNISNSVAAPSSESKAIVISNPSTYDSGLPDLISASNEVKAVATHFVADVFEKENATKEIFLRHHKEYDIIHFAAHSVFDEKFPFSSFIRLAGWETDDCKLKAYELIALNLKCSICNLSTCESGRYYVNSEKEVLGICSSILIAGAKNVVSSLWNVKDKSSSELMKLFYQSLATGVEAPVALTFAQRNIQEDNRFSHPVYWAAFYVIGT